MSFARDASHRAWRIEAGEAEGEAALEVAVEDDEEQQLDASAFALIGSQSQGGASSVVCMLRTSAEFCRGLSFALKGSSQLMKLMLMPGVKFVGRRFHMMGRKPRSLIVRLLF